MDIASIFSVHRAELVADGQLSVISDAYQQLLEMDDIEFPDGTLRHQMRQWDQYAADQRGAVELNPDGSVVDMTDFDRDVVGARFKTDRLPLANVERLRLLTDLGLTARAGSVALAHELTHEKTILARGEAVERPYAASLAHLNQYFKHFVQIALHTEEWAQPWQDLVANGFEGDPLTFPLDAEGVRHACGVLALEPFARIKQEGFRKLFLLSWNSFVGINAAPDTGDDERAHMIVAQIGAFYRQSPEGADGLIQQLIDDGALPAGIAWHEHMHVAIARSANRALAD